MTFLLGIGPPKTASSSTFSNLATNPKICFWREPKSEKFVEAQHLYGIESYDQSESPLLAHFPPFACCKAAIMKDPAWAGNLLAPYQMKEEFGSNPNAKFLLTIREPVRAMHSFYNFKCQAGRLSWTMHEACATDGDGFVAYVKNSTELELACIAETLGTGKTGKELATLQQRCWKYFSVRNWDYKATFHRFAEQFGEDRIFCQFVGDLADRGSQTRRSILDFIGAYDIDEDDMVVEGQSTDPYRLELNEDQLRQLEILFQTYAGKYDEAELRSLCTHTSG